MFADSRNGLRRVAVMATAGVVATGVLAGCGNTTKVPAIGYAVDAPVTSYNSGSTAGALGGAAAVFARVLPGFYTTGPVGQPVADTDVGTAQEVPGEVQTVQYRLNPEGTYSDGVSTSCDDLVLAWAARSGRFAPLFDAATTDGYSAIERVECEPGSKDATVVFRPDRYYQPWRTLFAAGDLMPAHIAADAAGVADVVSAVHSDDRAAIERIADFWNNGWNLTPGDLKLELLPASGPYRIKSYSESDGLILVSNEEWWGRKPETGRIVVWPQGTDYAAELAEGAIGVVDLGAGAVPDLDLGGFTEHTVAALGAEQLILGTGGVFESASARRSFGRCVPRQELYDTFGTVPDAPETGIGSGPLDAHVVAQDSLYYQAATGAADRYAEPAPDAARPGLDGKVIRIGYRTPDARRAGTVEAIAAACAAAGVTVEDAGAPDFVATQLRDGTVDAVLAGTAALSGPSGEHTQTMAFAAFGTGNGVNVGGFGNGRLDDIATELAATENPDAELNLLTEAENLLWHEMPAIPLFATPRQIAFTDGMEHAVVNPTRAGAGWNMDRWVLQR